VEWRLLGAVAYERMGKLSTAKTVYREILNETPVCTKALHVRVNFLKSFVKETVECGGVIGNSVVILYWCSQVHS
jgi:hypothetical protein